MSSAFIVASLLLDTRVVGRSNRNEDVLGDKGHRSRRSVSDKVDRL